MEINTVYVVAPAGHKTGGTELAHQLVKLLLENNIPACIAYTNVQEGLDPIHPAFREYVSDWIGAEDIQDKEGVVIIVPEINTLILEHYRRAYKIIWWMSVDFFEKNSCFQGVAKHFGYLRAIKRFFCGQINNKMGSIKCADLHLYQSEYARLYLESLGITNTYPLSDYINDSYFIDYQDNIRKDYVLYNPKKGIDFTKKLMQKFPDFMWTPIENMTTQQVGELLRKSKVYIDFGNHPGKDRFPREAAISGCCVITGMRGAAGNSEDVYIPQDYKFPDRMSSVPLIGATIKDCLENYDIRIKDFRAYQERIRNEKKKFETDALNLIQLIRGDSEEDGEK